MAFTSDTLSVIVQPLGGEGIRFFSYQTDDPKSDITATDYFANCKRFGMRAADLIFVAPAAGTIDPYVLVVDAVDSDGNATASETPFGLVADVQSYGAKGDGVTDDTAAIQAALDAMEVRGGGTVSVPWPATEYLLGSTVLVPNNCELVGYGVPNVLSGGQQFKYTGADVAFATKAGESDNPGRGANFLNLGVQITTAGATGFRIWRARDMTLRNCVVSLTANNQIGFHIKGEKDGGTRMGVFDCHFERLLSYDGSGALTGIVHYKLTGLLNNGQVNANTFVMCRGGGSGKFCQIGPSEGNTFIGPEAEALTDDYFHFEANAFNNKVFGGYVEAKSGWTAKVMKTDSGALRNEMYLGTVGVNTNLDTDLSLVAANRAYWAGRVYTGTSTNPGVSVRLAGDSQNGADLAKDGLYFGSGSGSTVNYYGLKHKTLNSLTLSASVTPDGSSGYMFYLNIDAATNPTINAPSNVADGESFDFHIINNSGGSRTLTWSTSYIKTSYLPTSLTAAQRFTARFRRQGGQYYLIGDFVVM